MEPNPLFRKTNKQLHRLKLNENDPVGECGCKKGCDKASVNDEESTSRDL